MSKVIAYILYGVSAVALVSIYFDRPLLGEVLPTFAVAVLAPLLIAGALRGLKQGRPPSSPSSPRRARGKQGE